MVLVWEMAKRWNLHKTQLWKLFWNLNSIKVTLFILRCKNSLHRWDRELVRRLEEAWSL